MLARFKSMTSSPNHVVPGGGPGRLFFVCLHSLTDKQLTMIEVDDDEEHPNKSKFDFEDQIFNTTFPNRLVSK
jgi:hypothetical protein